MHKYLLRLAVVSVVFSLLLGGCGPTKRPVDMGESHYKMAQASISTRDYTTALKHMLEAVRLKPNNPDYHRTLGEVYMYKKAWEQAEQHLQKALELRPGDPEVQHTLGALYFSMQRWDESAAMFRKAADNLLFHYPVLSLLGMGKAYVKGGHNTKAVLAFQEALERDPGNLRALWDLGDLYYIMHKYALAEKCLSKFLQIAPENRNVRLRLGETYLQLEQNDKAAREFREVANKEDQSDLGLKARAYLDLLQ